MPGKMPLPTEEMEQKLLFDWARMSCKAYPGL